MKKTFLFVLFLMVSLSGLAHAQSGSYTRDAVFQPRFPGETLRFTCALDSIDADTSRSFSLAKYDAAIRAGAPIFAQRTFTSAAGGVKISTYIDGSFDGTTWTAVDTLATDVTSESVTNVTIDMNYSAKPVFPYYRLRNAGVALNRSDSVADWIFYLYHRDD